jgi:hypothetical protein
MVIATEFICKCGKQKAWVDDGATKTEPCPDCGRRYCGKYNPKTLTIDAIELGKDWSPVK